MKMGNDETKQSSYRAMAILKVIKICLKYNGTTLITGGCITRLQKQSNYIKCVLTKGQLGLISPACKSACDHGQNGIN